MSGWIRAFAPATVGNLGVGFDVLGLALERPGDEVGVRRREEPGVVITRVEGSDRVPTDAGRNSAGVAAAALLRHFGETTGIELELRKRLPLAGGMGGSAASAVAAVVAVDALLDAHSARALLLRCALEGERAACGAAHPDNAAPSLFGGIVLTRISEPLDIVQLPVPEDLWVALVHPHLEVETAGARRLLGDTVPLSRAVQQWGNLAGLVAGLYREDWELIGRSLVDVVAEPLRSRQVPGFAAVKQAALEAGAFGCSLSGAGPSVFALCRGEEAAGRAGEAMRAAFAEAGVESDVHRTPPSRTGAGVVTGDPT